MVHVHLLEQLQYEFPAPLCSKNHYGFFQRCFRPLQLQFDHRLDPSREQNDGIFHLCPWSTVWRSFLEPQYLHYRLAWLESGFPNACTSWLRCASYVPLTLRWARARPFWYRPISGGKPRTKHEVQQYRLLTVWTTYPKALGHPPSGR